MNIEEALQKLKRLELQDFGKKRKFELKESEVAYITVLNELDKKDKVIDMMAEYIEEWTGSCPNDMKKCWIKYFYKKAEKN